MRIHELDENFGSSILKGATKLAPGLTKTAPTVVKHKQFKELLYTAAHIRSNLLVHIGQIAKDPADANKLTNMFNQLKGPAINGMTWTQLINQPPQVLNNPKMASALISNIKQTIEFVEAMILKYGNPAHPNYKVKMDYLNSAKDRYRAIVSP